MTCEFDWCATEHGAHAHPEDDDHRSPGVGSAALLRRVGGSGHGVDTELEVGVLRRRDDDQAWLVIDAGQGVGIEIAIDSARRIVHALVRDDAFRRLLSG